MVAAAPAAPPGTSLGGAAERLALFSRASPRSAPLDELLHDPSDPSVPVVARGGEGVRRQWQSLGGPPFAVLVGGVGGGSRPPPPVGERARSRGGLLGGSWYFTMFLAGSHAASAAGVSAKVAFSRYPLRRIASSRQISRAAGSEMSSGDPISKSGCAVLSAARLALPIPRALGLSTARRLRISRLNVVSFRLSMGATYGCLPWSSAICLMRSYNAPKAWYGVGRPVAIGAGVSLLLLVACRWQCCYSSRPLRARRARRSDRVRCGAGDDAPSTRSPERGGGSSRARGRLF